MLQKYTFQVGIQNKNTHVPDRLSDSSSESAERRNMGVFMDKLSTIQLPMAQKLFIYSIQQNTYGTKAMSQCLYNN